MFDLIASNAVLRSATLLGLFLLVVALVYFGSTAIAARRVTRQRLVEPNAGGEAAISGGSLRSSNAESAWLSLVNAVEKAGLSLVDTKDESLRQRLIAAGYTAPYAPRAYTLIRLISVLALPVIMIFLRTFVPKGLARRVKTLQPKAGIPYGIAITAGTLMMLVPGPGEKSAPYVPISAPAKAPAQSG